MLALNLIFYRFGIYMLLIDMFGSYGDPEYKEIIVLIYTGLIIFKIILPPIIMYFRRKFKNKVIILFNFYKILRK